MRTVILAAAVAALALNVSSASATDLANQDQAAYTVTVTTAEGSQDIEVAAASEVLDVCAGCSIAIHGAEPVTAEADDSVVILDGAISIQE